jgi:hypothetical protein
MKIRNAEATRLEEDYLARIRAALMRSGRSAAEAEEVVTSVREHINEAVEAQAGSEVSLTAMAAIIEQLGPVEAYVEAAAATDAAATPAPPPLPADAAQAVIPNLSEPFSFGRVFNDAVTLYRQNFLPMVLASMVFELLTTFTLFILLAPLSGGVALMTLRALERPDHRIDIADMFGAFRRFWPLLGVTVLSAGCVLLGLVMCIVPGVIMATLWCYPIYIMVEKRQGVMASLRGSVGIVTAPGRFGTNLLLVGTIWAITLASATIPYIGVVVAWVVAPLTWWIATVAYVQQTRGVQPAANPRVTPALV